MLLEEDELKQFYGGTAILVAFVFGCGAGVKVASHIWKWAHGGWWGGVAASASAILVAFLIIGCVVFPLDKRVREARKEYGEGEA